MARNDDFQRRCPHYGSKCKELIDYIFNYKSVNENTKFHIYDCANIFATPHNIIGRSIRTYDDEEEVVKHYLNENSTEDHFHIFVLNKTLNLYLNSADKYKYDTYDINDVLIYNRNKLYEDKQCKIYFIFTQSRIECDDRCVIWISIYLYWEYFIIKNNIKVYTQDNYDNPAHGRIPIYNHVVNEHFNDINNCQIKINNNDPRDIVWRDIITLQFGSHYSRQSDAVDEINYIKKSDDRRDYDDRRGDRRAGSSTYGDRRGDRRDYGSSTYDDRRDDGRDNGRDDRRAGSSTHGDRRYYGRDNGRDDRRAGSSTYGRGYWGDGSYLNKYLKYKQKYLELKKQLQI